MGTFITRILPVLLFSLAFVSVAFSQTYETLQGRIGSAPQWGSGWIDLDEQIDLERGERLRLTIGGSARRILIRYLPEGVDPNSPRGIDGGARAVPNNGVVELTLEEGHNNVVQISVHGGPAPWNIPLGGGNGPATLVRAERIK